MNESGIPIIKDLVLIGGGHSHIAVLKMFGMKPIPGVRLTLLTRDIHTPYSGMLPGFIAGHYDFDEAHIDLGPLCRFAGARLYHDSAVGIDTENRKIHCADRPAVPYDLLSINIGSTPKLENAGGAGTEIIPVKPISNFLGRWEALRQRVLEADHPLRIATVGAGAGGVEITLAIQYALKQLLAETDKSALEPQFHLFYDGPEILPSHNFKVRNYFEKVLKERNVQLYPGSRVESVSEGKLRREDGMEVPLDEILWVTEAAAPSWLGDSGLAIDENGFVKVNDSLRTLSHPDIFAAGDVAAVVNHPRPKAGVFAVRQGMPLAKNLRRALVSRSLRPFVPQRLFLSLISTGDKRAVASKGEWFYKGALVWLLKNWIDHRFMKKYNSLPDMPPVEELDVPKGLASKSALKELSSIAMRCGGCGAKVGATVLSRVIGRLSPVQRKDVLIGLDAPDDAAVTRTPRGKVLVQTIDSFRAIVEDPYVFGKIAANHSLGDIFAMGAAPQSALAVATVPYGPEEKVEDLLEQMLSGALEIFAETETALVGGHSSEGNELSLGFSVNGLVDPKKILQKSGMRPGDRILLTKALGTGTLFAADMRLAAKGRWIEGALASMLQSNLAAATCLHEFDATACTDVTGFGLLGHLVEMTRASRVDVRINLERIPLLDGAIETVSRGIFSPLQPQNLRLRRAIANTEEAAAAPCYPLIFDPQTSGGLLASVPARKADHCLERLRELGYPCAAVIGEVRERGRVPESVYLEPGD